VSGDCGSFSVIDVLGHYGEHWLHKVADRGTPLRMVERVVLNIHVEGVAYKHCLAEGKLNLKVGQIRAAERLSVSNQTQGSSYLQRMM